MLLKMAVRGGGKKGESLSGHPPTVRLPVTDKRKWGQ